MAIVQCKECGHTVSDIAESCPSCGAPPSKKKAGIGVYMVVGALLGSLFFFFDRTFDTNTFGLSSKSQLEVVDWQWTRNEYGNRSITGTVRNNSSKQYSYVVVEINLYDENGAQVGSAIDNLNNFEPGSTWKFEAIVLADSATEAKIKSVDGF